MVTSHPAPSVELATWLIRANPLQTPLPMITAAISLVSSAGGTSYDPHRVKQFSMLVLPANQAFGERHLLLSENAFFRDRLLYVLLIQQLTRFGRDRVDSGFADLL
jgi:hypothetical protein